VGEGSTGACSPSLSLPLRSSCFLHTLSDASLSSTQAAALANDAWRALDKPGLVAAGAPPGRNFVRPSEDEIRRAKDQAAQRVAPLDRHGRKGAAAYEGGGGRGMGGGGL